MATRIIQSGRRIQSPGVQITEIDLTRPPRRRGRPLRPAAMVTGFTSQGPTDEVVMLRSYRQFVDIFGRPETSAERYLSHTVEQLCASGSDVYVTRMPYGKGGGENSVQNFYSALFYPILPHGTTYSNAEAYYILPPKSVLLSENEYQEYIKDENINWKSNTFVSSVSTVYNRTYTLNRNVASSILLDISRDYRLTDTDVINSIIGWNAYEGPTRPINQLFISKPLSSINVGVAFANRLQESIDLQATIQAQSWGIGKIHGAPTSWATVKETLVDLPDWESYVDGVSTRNFSYDISFHTADSLNKLQASSVDVISQAGMIIVNVDKSPVNELFEGFYVALQDNSDDTPYTDFKAVTAVKTVTSRTEVTPNKWTQEFYTIPEDRLNFTLTEEVSSATFQSVSERMARYPGYDFSDDAFNDCLKLFLFRLNVSAYLQDSITLNYGTVEAYIGSLYDKRMQNDPRGGRLRAFGLQNKVDNRRNSRIKLLLNPEISRAGDWIDENGKPTKRVFVSDGAKCLWTMGNYTPMSVYRSDKTIGDLMIKLDRVFQTLELQENQTINIDLFAEAGLGTINAAVSAGYAQDVYFDGAYDETDVVDTSNLKVIPKNWREYYQQPDPVRDGYVAIQKRFRNYAQTVKNHVFVSDPLRNIFVNGRSSKVSERKTFNFVNDILRPMNITYALCGRSTYMASYANWLKRYDSTSDQFVWLPPSGFIGRTMLNAKKRSPWTAPAGFRYGRLYGITDLAVNPNQRQRDLLYRYSYNPIVNFKYDGIAVYGQKTFIKYRSAFDRLNVRNLFLHLEKVTTRVLNRFVFQPNTIPTRNRVVLSLTPTFEAAKRREGIYDYRIVCDERNNTPRSIDRNELRVAIYIQPVRTAEFILADFIATRTGVDLDSYVS